MEQFENISFENDISNSLGQDYDFNFDSQIDEIAREVHRDNEVEENIFGHIAPVINNSISSAETLDALNNNEIGDARLFSRLHRDKFCFDPLLEQWFKFNGHYWEEDRRGNATVAVDAVVEVYSLELDRQSQLKLTAIRNQNKNEEEQAKKCESRLIKRIHDLQTVYRRKNILYLATKGDSSLSITGNEWDRDPWLLACRNGVIDLKTGELRPGRPGNYLKTVVPTEWKGLYEPAPEWEKFLLDILENRGEMPSYLQRLFGYGITGSTEDHVNPIFWGHHGRNGKGTIFETLLHVLGTCAGPVPSEMLLKNGAAKSSAGHSADIMTLRGRRLAWASETDEGRGLAIGRVKLFTGGDTITARPPYGKRMIEFTPTHKLFLMTNHRPVIPPTEYAMWQRIHLIPFNLSYVDDLREDFERKRDPKLPEKLKAEASGILAWLVRGCLEWQNKGLDPPDYVKEAVSQYQEDEDTLGLFISECTEKDSDESVRASDLYGAYKRWCDLYGHKPLGGKKFGERMGEKFKKTKKTAANYYKGLTLTDFGPEKTCSSYSSYSS